ncbi:MAG TPA: aldehyde dehydrogenase family protein [Acidimicrobiales bacterium]|nr:aldehyde dehydrogenase family protein [Acidimicrobiales bacterium]
MTLTTRGAAAPVHAEERVDAGSLDAAVLSVAANVDRWASTGPAAREALLARVVASLADAAPAWHLAACEAKGLDPNGYDGGEELVAGVGVLARLAQQLRQSLHEIGRDGRPRIPGPVRHVPGGRLAMGVVPRSTWDRVLLPRQLGEVWAQPGLALDDVVSGQARAYQDPEGHRGVACVLGAGNVASLGPNDALSKLFVEGKVVVLKANPVNDYLVEHWERALKPLVDEGVLRIVRGGGAAGAHLVNHSLVDEVHVTGSDKTFEAIVFGPGEEGRRRKEANVRLLTKRVTAELGSVSPVVVVPGRWSAKDLSYQAAHVASMLVNNAGFNCVTPRVLVTWRHWPQREAFLNELECVLSTIPTRLAYYPGASERHEAFVSTHEGARLLGAADEGRLPWTLLRGLDARRHDDTALNVEAFCSLMAETALDTATPDQFVDAAVEFCNDVVWGTLGATVLAHPSQLKDPLVGGRVDAAIASLRFGSIGLNVWHAWSFAFGTTTWGAFPGHHPTDIQSGVGVVGNALMFDRPEKSIVSGPFRVTPTPPTFATARASNAALRRFVSMQLDPSVAKLPGLVAAALR